MNMLDKVKSELVVSCQALDNEPLHSSYIMGRMAIAAEEGGAKGIRSNSKEDIIEIKKNTDLPVIGIVKRDYEDSEVFITATMKEIDELAESKCDMIALDATDRIRPNGETLETFVQAIRSKYPSILLMADASTVEEVIEAEKIGFDCVSTTLMGYTKKSEGQNIADNDFERLKIILDTVNVPVIVEGHIDTPEKAKRCKELGVHSIVVGSAITRPQLITAGFVEKMKEVK
ncbi:N-acetylmannosamine-6-phosphate 2-epimerase [Carnobacterium inhibens]|jgi:N-acylglucosamine-6-phosphate 2-epimerase|uniref:Putative N-acetylmannosamine-6-phosphate 2-epimerase n=2 Tax=Carnobacterium inhibens TaxID=147709 RepID=U5SAU6_9LACT|nr:N-acetylmannosamine-6-phosphate 2-epimerase [Carnobacterium inhibens]AGY82156.1 N-acetylmannosamine-6-phosphate 2-epimerase [Carnobacterium inhibens subsp. gilichinskyi]MBC9824293.1 putative N-acetylmannosamine-6-phosphate 2-epimerase [Carnobacterium inhibens]MCM3511615.1 N-acetylmannosamine-6-phosphate 2-epimerase [Carnobacterium inhibens]